MMTACRPRDISRMKYQKKGMKKSFLTRAFARILIVCGAILVHIGAARTRGSCLTSVPPSARTSSVSLVAYVFEVMGPVFDTNAEFDVSGYITQHINESSILLGRNT